MVRGGLVVLGGLVVMGGLVATGGLLVFCVVGRYGWFGGVLCGWSLRVVGL